jgi:uncharacterized heparinase superfamily protein
MKLAKTREVWRDQSAASIPRPSEGRAGAVLGGAIFSPRIEGLGLSIRPLLDGDAAAGEAIYHGAFRFAGTEVACRGTVVFDCMPDEAPWREALHGFAWLADIAATGRELHRLHARALVSDWIDRRRHRESPTSLAVAGRRLQSWLTSASYLCQGATEGFCDSFFASLARQVRELQRRVLLPGAADRLQAAVGLAYAGLGLRGLESLRPTAFAILGSALDSNVLPDGGHVSRSPQALLRLLLDLLPLRIACESARIELPAAVHGALERMLPMLRFFLHGDGGLAIFQGAGDPMIPACQAVLAADGVNGRPVAHAVHSGFGRMEGGAAAAVIRLPEIDDPQSESRFQDGLAFEFSDATDRVVINCGIPVLDSPELFAAGRMMEAHSTLTLEGAAAGGSYSSGMLGRMLARGPTGRTRPLPPRFESSPVGALVEGSRTLQAGTSSLVHHRTLFLSARGNDLRGEDTLAAHPARPTAEISFAIRFHLHPTVTATVSQDGASVMLKTEHAGWRFLASGAKIGLEESIRLWGAGGPRKSVQIVLRADAGAAARVVWAFKRADRLDLPVVAADELQLPL